MKASTNLKKTFPLSELKHVGDLLIEEDIESESFLGRGLDSRFQASSVQQDRPVDLGGRSKGGSNHCGRILSGGTTHQPSSILNGPKYKIPVTETTLRPNKEVIDTSLQSNNDVTTENHTNAELVTMFDADNNKKEKAEEKSRTVTEPQVSIPPTGNQVRLTSASKRTPGITSKTSVEQKGGLTQVLTGLERDIQGKKRLMEERLKMGRKRWNECDRSENKNSGLRYFVDRRKKEPVATKEPPKPPEEAVRASSSKGRDRVDSRPGSEMGKSSAVRFRSCEGLALGPEAIMALKFLLFGMSSRGFSKEWLSHHLGFTQTNKSPYSMMVKQSGMSGLIMAIEAELLREILFSDRKTNSSRLKLSDEVRENHLSIALSRILWRCGDKERARVCVNDMEMTHEESSDSQNYDGFSEKIMQYFFEKEDDLQSFMKKKLSCFTTPNRQGLVLFIYSTILSRGIDKCQWELDISTDRLINSQSSAGQELLNLFLTGSCVSHCFNDVILHGSRRIQGISQRSDIGFLSTHKHCSLCQQMGSRYKTPRFPIWVLECSSSIPNSAPTFCLLFSTQAGLTGDWRAERHFQVHLTAGLVGGGPLDEITLTIDTRGFRSDSTKSGLKVIENESSEEEIVDDSDEERTSKPISPITLALKTKWPGAKIDWNKTTPLIF